MILENSRILDNKLSENVDILKEKYDLEGGLKHVCEEKDVAIAHTKYNWCYLFDSGLKKARMVCCSGFEILTTNHQKKSHWYISTKIGY